MNRNRKAFFVLLILILAVLTGCSRPVPEEAPQTELQVEEETPFLLKAASDLLPQSEEYQELVRLKEEVEQQSGGGMEVQLYPGSQLGTQDVILEGLRTGTVEMAVLPLSSLGQISPGITGFLAPFGGMDHDTAAAYCESAEMEECLQTIREETGIRVIAMAVKGNRNIWTRQQIESAEDLQNLRLNVLDTPGYTEAFQKLGVIPSSMRLSQIFDALKTGLLDGAELDMEEAYEFKIHESCRYCLESSHGISIQAVLVSDSIFEMMKQEQRDILTRTAAEIAEAVSERALQQEAEIRKEMEEKGVVFYNIKIP